ncbi:MAG: hypothetical protein GHCLOJNM_04516 [bacterium]|nr:hypothetical protein [bacterium]
MVSLLWLLVRARSASWRNILLVGLGALIALAKILAVDFSWNTPGPTATPPIRIVHWNVWHTRPGIEPVISTLLQDQADIVVLSEPPEGEDLDRIARAVLPGATPYCVNSVALLCRYPFEDIGGVWFSGGRAWCARIDTPQGRMLLVGSDIKANPFRDRGVPLDGIAEWVEKQDPSTPILVIGDFNTPRDSVHFGAMRRRLENAYEEVGRGWPYTWPVPVPMISIDHAWFNSRVQVHSYELRSAWCSDHRRQVLEFSLR